MRRWLKVGGLAAWLAVASAHASNDDLFPRPVVLKPNIAFWTKVFGDYSEYQSAIVHTGATYKIYTVLDFQDLIAAGKSPVEVRRLQRKEEERVKRQIDQQLRRVHQFRDNPDALEGQERLLWSLFSDSDDPNRFTKAIGEWRAQRGLKERTKLALQTSGAYLPEMERIFESYGLPTMLTRLPLVESSFNVEAYSKVGAAGLWQFMPSSARIYMRLNEAVDDRADPWTSTDAAARHLRDDYEALGNWPLALTAYNHGRAGLARGLRETGGSTLEDLLTRWKTGKRFGYASRNFYAEFIAATDVERAHPEYFGDFERHSAVTFESVSTEHFVTYDTLRRCAGVDDTTFRRLNPAYRPEVIEGKLYVPPTQNIRVPVGNGDSFRALYTALTPEERFSEQRFYYSQHRVASGETLDRIARRHGVSLRNLLSANPNIKPSRLRIGQQLRIPPRGANEKNSRGRLVKAVETAPPATDADGLRLHRVKSGQTLSDIARRYRVTLLSLIELNQLGEERLIRAGSLLKIPTS